MTDAIKLRALLKRIDAKIAKAPTAKTHWIIVSPEDAQSLRGLLLLQAG